jgi:hypothetical protein
LGGIVFVLRTGCPWRLLLKELGCGSGTTCWRRLRDWQVAGVWHRLHERLLTWLGDLADADRSQAPAAEYGDAVSVIGSRAFVLQDDVWVETTYDPSTMTPIQVQFGSEEYFQLLAEDPALAEAFALGPRVIAVSGGQAYEVVE